MANHTSRQQLLVSSQAGWRHRQAHLHVSRVVFPLFDDLKGVIDQVVEDGELPVPQAVSEAFWHGVRHPREKTQDLAVQTDE